MFNELKRCFLFLFQFRCQQIDERSVEAAAGPDQRGDRQSQRPTAPPLVHEAEALPASAHGPRLCVRQKSKLLPTRQIKLSNQTK
ncbi:hypothetical protein TNIN_443821 [Trichonephila inaurata madagascariensis]|uniref:Uncharacterized protein n=1 Tax=Trichonephila inaurata madagascariensis TaxID=2747483 RepID=A0A8X6M872_9ARAC|nr:hypothetical protein TNIN_443821 [Trichonephila inaurata madagascariensis]